MTKGIADIPEWFHGCRLNFAENLLQCQEDKVALITYGEWQPESCVFVFLISYDVYHLSCVVYICRFLRRLTTGDLFMETRSCAHFARFSYLLCSLQLLALLDSGSLEASVKL